MGPDARAAARAMRRALALLEAASSDWRARGPSDGSTPLYWPLAAAAARAQLTHALERLAAAEDLAGDAPQAAAASASAAHREHTQPQPTGDPS